jgi:cysteinyl-tRNA synthetase
MTLRIYNTLSHEIEEFAPLEKGRVRMYNCGPTVYNYQHIGNYRTYLFADLLRRYLEYKGYQVTQIINITDVGHLTQDDVEAGDDKIQVMAKKLGWDPYKVADHFAQAYFEDRKALGMLEPHKFPRATEHVPEMIAWIEKLFARGVAYQVGPNVYFDVTKFPGYGRLSGNTLEQIRSGARIEINPEKRHPADFALWKHDPKHLMQWDSPWGRGFPGWHIECSAMSTKYLGESFDIHTGGEDNIFPHHECEIAQTEAVTGRPFVKYWIHSRHLLWEGDKMSKSKEGSLFRPKELFDRGFSPMAVRLALASTRYREQVSFSLKIFEDAERQLERLTEFKRRLQGVIDSGVKRRRGADVEEFIGKAAVSFENAMDDDLNVSGALSAIHDFAREVNRAIDQSGVDSEEAGLAMEILDRFNHVFGVLPKAVEVEAPAEVVELARQREEARKRKDFKASDQLRDKIRSLGWLVEDTKSGPKFRHL